MKFLTLLGFATGLSFVGLCGVPTARAIPIEYTVDFSSQYSVALPAASFYYDATTQTFSDFLVTLQGVTYDMTNAANNPGFTGSAIPCLNGATGAAASFALLDGACASAPYTSAYWEGYQASQGGSFTFLDAYQVPRGDVGQMRLLQEGLGSDQQYQQPGSFSISPTISSVPEPNGVSCWEARLRWFCFSERRFRAVFARPEAA